MANETKTAENNKNPISNSIDSLRPRSVTVHSYLIGLIILVVIAAAVLASIFYTKYYNLKKDPQKAAQDQVTELVAKVGNLIILPQGETPTVATVSDLGPLKDQPFFANAKVGDKVLIYATAKKAILYDPVVNKIVEVAPVTNGQPQADQSTTVTVPKK